MEALAPMFVNAFAFIVLTVCFTSTQTTLDMLSTLLTPRRNQYAPVYFKELSIFSIPNKQRPCQWPSRLIKPLDPDQGIILSCNTPFQFINQLIIILQRKIIIMVTAARLEIIG